MKWDEYKSTLTENKVDDAMYNAELIARYFNSKHIYTGDGPEMVYVPMVHLCGRKKKEEEENKEYSLLGLPPMALKRPIGFYDMVDATEALDSFPGIYTTILHASLRDNQ